MRSPAVFVPRRKSSLEITLWLLLASITILLSGCGGPLRAYYYEDKQQYRYYETKSDDILLVAPNGKVANVTGFVSGVGYPSLDEREDLIWHTGQKPEPPVVIPNESQPQWFPWGNWPLSPPDSEPATPLPMPKKEPPPLALLMVGTATWQSDIADWDMNAYEIVPETGYCRVNALAWSPWFDLSYSIRPQDHFFKRRSCWNLIWAIPTYLVADTILLIGPLVTMFPAGTGSH